MLVCEDIVLARMDAKQGTGQEEEKAPTAGRCQEHSTEEHDAFHLHADLLKVQQRTARLDNSRGCCYRQYAQHAQRTAAPMTGIVASPSFFD
jgi:hypothetical protein